MADILDIPGAHAVELPSPRGPLQGVATSTGGLLSIFERGPVATSTEIRSWEEFKVVFGENVIGSYGAYAAKGFFDNGGQKLLVARVVGSGVANSTVTLVDRDGTPISTLKVDAISPGLWGDGLSITIEDATLDSANKFKLIVKLDGVIKETFDELSMDDAESFGRFVESVINGGGSNYIEVLDLDSGSAPADQRPANQVDTSLAGGAAGATVVDADFIALLNYGAGGVFDAIQENLNIFTAGFNGTGFVVAKAGCNYAEDSNKHSFIADVDANRTIAQMKSDRLLIGDESYGATYGPWILINDPFGIGSNPVKFVPVSGHVAGVTARIDRTRGVHKAAAGAEAKVEGAIGVQVRISDTATATLNPAGVNSIRIMPSMGIVIWGNRSMAQNDIKLRFFQTRRFLNFLKTSFVLDFQFSVFEPNDDTLWGQLIRRGTFFLTEQWKKRALFGLSAALAFFIKCDAELNTETEIDAGRVKYRVGVRPTRPAEVIILEFSQFDGGATVTEA